MQSGNLPWLVGSFGILFGILILAKWWQTAGLRAPVSSKLLRPPGESLRLRLELIDERLNLCLALYAFTTALVFATPYPKNAAWIIQSMFALALIGLATWLGHLLRERRNYALGFNGERLVGEGLNRLVAHGCHVFHDLPTETLGNIDHVVVSPVGVFVVETKTRRKGRKGRKQPDHVVVFDGEQLKYPNCNDRHGLEQARRNASWLASFLGKATGEGVSVEAILTLPGWFIERRGKGNFHLLNPGEIRKVVTGKHRLADDQIKRIVHQLDQRCRDVDF